MRPLVWRLPKPALMQQPMQGEKLVERSRKSILVDGNNVLYQYFDPLCPMESDGKKVGAINGMFQLLQRLDKKHAPQHISVFFDSPNQPTVRKLMDPTYKQDRRPTPRELRPQLTSVPSMLRSANVNAIICPGIESDDMIASYANALHASNYDVLIVSNDNDFLQLTRGAPPSMHLGNEEVPTGVTANNEEDKTSAYVEVYQMNKRRYLRERHVRSRFSVAPSQLPAYFALCGMPRGKLPRVEGMTDEMAVELLAKYETLPRLLRSLNEIEDEQLRKTMKQSISSIESGYRISKLNDSLELPLPIEAFSAPVVSALPDLAGPFVVR